MQEKGYTFKQKCNRNGVFLSRECITRRQSLKFSALHANFQQFCSHKGTFWQHLPGKQHVFYQKMQQKGCLFPKKCNRKGTVSETALAHPRTKNRQVPPPPGWPPSSPSSFSPSPPCSRNDHSGWVRINRLVYLRAVPFEILRGGQNRISNSKFFRGPKAILNQTEDSALQNQNIPIIGGSSPP